MKSRKSWNDQEEQFLIENYIHFGLAELAEKLNRTKGSVKTRILKLKLTLPEEIRKVRKATRPNNWSIAEDEFLKKKYILHTCAEMASLLNKTKHAVKNRVNKLKIYLPEDVKNERKKQSCFKPGHVSHNKGKRWTEFMSEESRKRSLRTAFKPGNKPHNTKSNETITVRKDNRGVPYQFIRIAESEWEYLHVHIYKRVYRTVPDGYMVYFKNGDTMDCRPANLGLQTRAENMLKNSIHQYPEELVSTIRTLSKLKKIIHGKKQNQ